ncbi:MAG: hypothetical protein LUE08_07100 [Akkermansiaceae bacterium]|nr:hypothetical protein [Akkermansiaceae bacterium]
MSWIKFDSVTPEKPEIIKAARILGIDRFAVLGRVCALWCWADAHSSDGNLGLTPEDVDALFAQPGLTDALAAVGWLAIGEDGEVAMTSWDTHNGASAKKRAQEAKRTAARKLRVSQETSVSEDEQNSENGHASVTHRSRSERDLEKEKEKNINNTSPPDNSTVVLGDNRSSDCVPSPQNPEEVRLFMEAQPVHPPEKVNLERCSEAFFDDFSARGWRDARGVPLNDWHPAARKYARTWAENNRKAVSVSKRDANEGRRYTL